MSHYKANLYVLDNEGNIVEDTIIENDSDTTLTAKQLKEKLNNGKYTNILSEEISSQKKVYSDNDNVVFPFDSKVDLGIFHVYAWSAGPSVIDNSKSSVLLGISIKAILTLLGDSANISYNIISASESNVIELKFK